MRIFGGEKVIAGARLPTGDEPTLTRERERGVMMGYMAGKCEVAYRTEDFHSGIQSVLQARMPRSVNSVESIMFGIQMDGANILSDLELINLDYNGYPFVD